MGDRQTLVVIEVKSLKGKLLPQGWVLILETTKRGFEQKLVVQSTTIVQWLDLYVASLGRGAADEAVFPCSYSRVSRWLRKSTHELGFGAINWTSHGLRRGGASELIAKGWSFESVMLAGCWASQRSAAEYVRRGEAHGVAASLLALPGAVDRGGVTEDALQGLALMIAWCSLARNDCYWTAWHGMTVNGMLGQGMTESGTRHGSE
eukprot:316047-Amphidinium_carterae.1